MKNGDDPSKFFIERDKIIQVLESLGVHKDEESVCVKLLDGLAEEYHHERQTMQTVVDNITRSHMETVAWRRFADLSLEAKTPVNHGQALIVGRSGRKGSYRKSRGRKSNSSSNGGTGDR